MASPGHHFMKDYCKHVLFVGPDYHLRGGMASVLEVYSRQIPAFRFLPTYRYKNPLPRTLFFALALLKMTGMLLFNPRIKIVHIHTACRGSFIRKSVVLHLARLLGRKTILHMHGGEFKVYYRESGRLKPYILYTLNAADELAVLSEEWKNYFDSLTSRQKSMVIHNPVDMPASVDPLHPGIPVELLYMNHITTKKGFFDILQVLINQRDQLKGKIKLTIAGSGAESPRMMQLIEQHELHDLVDCKGWVGGAEKETLLRNCHAFILTSYFEGLPMSILEAMAMGKPVISTRVGGIPTIVKPGINGWLINPGDVNTLAGILQEIIAAPAVLSQYGQQSLHMVKDYSAVKVVEKLNSLYEYVMKGATVSDQRSLYEKVN